jgi:hypothetical protein
MADLKLPRLPDRTPVKLTISVPPDLKHALDDYAAAYEAAYGQSESIAELIPAIVAAFLDADRAFNAARRKLASEM